ncbi:hypothetical protein FYJ37_09560 [[Clostridium] scindens]|uniref:Uncharacterized protein n=1 Tax=Clostridium scindens (strain JCM 10418 / VPI 12708) TaxID=29347 RepID=A0A844FBV8_CLOSV|nr:hypothetical protein [[Clostridium] scindens]
MLCHNKRLSYDFYFIIEEPFKCYCTEKVGVVFKDLGVNYYNQFNKERKSNNYSITLLKTYRSNLSNAS